MSLTTRSLRILALLVMSASLLIPLASSSDAAVTINVTTRNDELNTDSDCSLREAIVTVNSGVAEDDCPTPDTQANKIVLKTGTYKLKVGNTEENVGEEGDLDITHPDTEIVGKGMNATTVDADGIDRVFHTLADTRFANLAIYGGEVTNTSGGGLAIDAGKTTLDHVRVVNNEVTGGDSTYVGGGIVNYSDLDIRNSDITQNLAPRGAGIFSTGSGMLELSRSTVHNNIGAASYGGAGLETYIATTLANVTIANNTGADGGAGGGVVVGDSATLDMRFTTIAKNDPGNFYINGTVQNTEASIIADPISGDNCVIETGGSAGSVGINIDEDATCFNNTDFEKDPELRPLGDWGGPIPTMPLKPTSPARNTAFEVCVATDARGAPRPQVNCDAGATTSQQDLGAYELVRCAGTVVDVVGTPQDDVLKGSGGANGIIALGGDDEVAAGDGNDKACGGDGKDLLKGQGDKDKLLGQAGNDSLNGGPARDRCIGGPGNDSATNCEVKKSI
jgi:CSLREA domain-containing protein